MSTFEELPLDEVQALKTVLEAWLILYYAHHEWPGWGEPFMSQITTTLRRAPQLADNLERIAANTPTGPDPAADVEQPGAIEGAAVATREIDEQHIEKLDRRLRHLRDACVAQAKAEDFDRLLPIIHGPGWTTPIQLHLVDRLVEATQRTADDLHRLRKALLDTAAAIGELTST
jgi:hypothetical protein